MSTSKTLKTPLRYPGGKSRALSKLFQFIPDLSRYTEYREPFLGGGSVALEIGKRYPHLKIWVNDLYDPLYNFWREIQDNGEQVQKELKDLKSIHCNQDSARCLFQSMKEVINDEEKSNLDRAIAFYIVNKCSFSGLTESSSFSEQASDANFSMRGIDKLPMYTELIKNWYITNVDYRHMLGDGEKTFVYLDPPYDIKDNLYGKKGSMHKKFNHDNFAESCEIYNLSLIHI